MNMTKNHGAKRGKQDGAKQKDSFQYFFFSYFEEWEYEVEEENAEI